MKRVHFYTYKTVGFTLIELLVVVAIIGMLAAIVFGSLSGSREQARIATAQAELNQIYKGTFRFNLDTGLWPSGTAGVTDLCTAPVNPNEIATNEPNAGLVSNGRSVAGWNGPYYSDVLDPWGTPYYFDSDYDCTAGSIGCEGHEGGGQNDSVIVSCGPNGLEAIGACVYDDDNIVYHLCDNGM